MYEKRAYQEECIKIINSKKNGSYLIRMATGLGKTYIFTHIKRQGRTLILAHREELIFQPIKYYTCPVGIEMGKHRSNGEEVIIASVRSLVRRLNKFNPNDFDTIIIDEAHHAPAETYRKIINYFTPRLLLGFTATPKRGDNVKLNDIFSEIIYDKDIKWGIKNNYLCNINCLRIDLGYDLSKVHNRMGDFSQSELDRAVNIKWANKALGDVYKKYATGQTLIFATSIEHAFNIQKEIKDSYVITGKTENRSKILKRFLDKKIKCIINVDVFTEGTDLPNIETIIMARPTQSVSAYIQRVGRGLRLYTGKKELLLIDCVGDSGKHNLCTAPSLLGLSTELVPKEKLSNIQGKLFELEEKIQIESDVPESWIKNAKYVDIWAKENDYDTKGINFYQMPDGSLNCRIPAPKEKQNNPRTIVQEIITIPYPDELGFTYYNGKLMLMQDAINAVYNYLLKHRRYCESIWNIEKVKEWGKDKATQKQINKIHQFIPEFNCSKLTKHEASEILNRLLGGYSSEKESNNMLLNQLETDSVFSFKKEKTYAIVNISTTGNDPKADDIYRLTIVKFNSNFEQINKFDTFIYSPLNSSRSYYKKFKIESPRLLPSVVNAFSSAQAFLGDCPVLAHKIEYALNFMHHKNLYLKNRFYDTELMAKKVFTGFKHYGLNTLESLLLLKKSRANDFIEEKISLTNELVKECLKKKGDIKNVKEL